METVTVELINKKALRLLEELEALSIIRLHKTEEKRVVNDKASKYRGFMSTDTADAFLKTTVESRNEWEQRFPRFR